MAKPNAPMMHMPRGFWSSPAVLCESGLGSQVSGTDVNGRSVSRGLGAQLNDIHVVGHE